LGTYAATDVTATFTVATRYDSVDAFVEEGALPGRVRSTHIEVTADVSDGWIRAATWNGCAYPGTAPFWLQGTSCVLTPQSWDNEYSDDTRPLSVLGLEVHDWDDQLRPTAVASQAPCAASDSAFVFDPVVSSVVTVHATTFASGTEPGCSPVSQDFALHTGNWQLAPCTTFDVCL
jgi:hypothetical protein